MSVFLWLKAPASGAGRQAFGEEALIRLVHVLNFFINFADNLLLLFLSEEGMSRSLEHVNSDSSVFLVDNFGSSHDSNSNDYEFSLQSRFKGNKPDLLKGFGVSGSNCVTG